MALTFYNSYLEIATTPKDGYLEHLQATIDDQFDNAINVFTIGEELTFGTKTFTNIDARVESSIRSETGTRLSDDFKKLVFQYNTHATGIGYRYSFANNYWLGINADNILSPTNSVQVRRCNNTMKWFDENDVLYSEPCVFDYDLRDTTFDYDKQQNIVSGELKAWVQDNTTSSKIKINQRFIFNGYAYVVNNINKQSIENLYTFTFTEVVVDVNDDLINNIANAYNRPETGIVPTVPNEIRITPYLEEIFEGDTQVYTVGLYALNVLQPATFTYALTGLANDGTHYTFTNISGNSFSVKNLLKSSTQLTVTCTTGVQTKVINITLKGLW